MTKTLKLAAATLTVLALAACTPKKYLLHESFIPGSAKVGKASIKPVGSKKEAMLSNYYIQICDVQAGRSTNCKTNLVLTNITDYQVDLGRVY